MLEKRKNEGLACGKMLMKFSFCHALSSVLESHNRINKISQNGIATAEKWNNRKSVKMVIIQFLKQIRQNRKNSVLIAGGKLVNEMLCVRIVHIYCSHNI